MENNKSSCEIVYKQTHVFSIDASQLLVLVKIFFFGRVEGWGTPKKSSVACGILSSPTKDLPQVACIGSTES